MHLYRPALGAVLMLTSMCIFPIGEAATKFISDSYSPLHLAWSRFAVGAFVLSSIVLLTHSFEKSIIKPKVLKEQTVRALCILSTTVCFVAAIARIPLTDSFGTYMIGPIVAMILAVLFLKERLTPRKILAACFGFIGAIIVVNPSVSMNIGYWFAVGAGISFGAYLVATRWAASSVPPLLAVTFQTLFGTVVLLPFGWRLLLEIDLSHLWLFAIIGIGSASANMLTISANKYAPSTLLAPLVYTEIIVASVLGYIIFKDTPSMQTWLGISVIVFGGLILIKKSPEQ